MTEDEQRQRLSEKLDNVTVRLMVASSEKDRNKIKQCRIEARRILMDYEQFISDLGDD